MKVAIVCDWLTNVGGAEKVILAVHQMFPEAPIFTSQYNPRGIDWFNDATVKTGWMQFFPSKLRRIFSVFRQRYFDKLDLSEYDLIISVTGAEAKSIKKGKALHICYCHVPTQYYWQMYNDYIKHPGFNRWVDPMVRRVFKILVKPLREADFRAAQRPDYFVTISEYAAAQIKKYYKREAKVIAPPVEIEKFQPNRVLKGKRTRKGFINFSRQVSWKRQDLAVRACIAEKIPLTMIGDGPEHQNLVRIANKSPFIKFLPNMTSVQLRKQLEFAEGFIFPSKEPFGIAPVEALASGCPVIAFKEGGARDYINDGKNGVFFEKQNVESVRAGILKFQKIKFNAEVVSESAEKFSTEMFKQKLEEFINEKLKEKK